ncbi:hypothetical protein E2C01_060636 [Portunus trituberculatus]|uniref:Uncharacterized protein n=1 Tax=Portunus trituberculatus TaxID=210409 RepID=A0A5B7HBZ7_PORTR|nr:hypothetical protein [Portunus trituberculatus]
MVSKSYLLWRQENPMVPYPLYICIGQAPMPAEVLSLGDA